MVIEKEQPEVAAHWCYPRRIRMTQDLRKPLQLLLWLDGPPSHPSCLVTAEQKWRVCLTLRGSMLEK